MSFGVSAGQVAIMFSLMSLGWLAFRLKWVGDEAVKGMTKLLMFIINPVVIVSAFLRPFDPARLQLIGLTFALDVVVFGLTIGIARLLFARRLIPDPERRTALRFGTIYTNCGFLGIPLAQALLGDDGVFFMVAFVVTFHIFVWTHGDGLFGGNREGARDNRLLEVVLNPNIIATALGLTLFVASIPLPGLVTQAAGYVSAMNAPLSMIVIGANLAAIGLRSVFADRDAWLGVVARNVLVPAVFVGLFVLVPLDQTAKMATLIGLATPVGAFVVMFSVLHGRPTGFPTRFLTLSTLASIVTIPAALGLASAIW